MWETEEEGAIRQDLHLPVALQIRQGLEGTSVGLSRVDINSRDSDQNKQTSQQKEAKIGKVNVEVTTDVLCFQRSQAH